MELVLQPMDIFIEICRIFWQIKKTRGSFYYSKRGNRLARTSKNFHREIIQTTMSEQLNQALARVFPHNIKEFDVSYNYSDTRLVFSFLFGILFAIKHFVLFLMAYVK